ncbi:hypothetical protein EMCRGX_G004846 [Ephydatia muelleri]
MDGEVRRIADTIGKDWKLLAFQLDFQRADVEAIECAYPHNPSDRVRALLDAWRQREGSAATVGSLHDALRTANIQLRNAHHEVICVIPPPPSELSNPKFGA